MMTATANHEDDRLLIRRAIERHTRKAVVCEAQNGSEALRQLRERGSRPSFNLVLLDINMPLMNEFEGLGQFVHRRR